VWMTIKLVAALYVISFVWFWSLCRLSVPHKTEGTHPERRSKLIPFERGVKLKDAELFDSTVPSQLRRTP
jgi:hypothetical protein